MPPALSATTAPIARRKSPRRQRPLPQPARRPRPKLPPRRKSQDSSARSGISSARFLGRIRDCFPFRIPYSLFLTRREARWLHRARFLARSAFFRADNVGAITTRPMNLSFCLRTDLRIVTVKCRSQRSAITGSTFSPRQVGMCRCPARLVVSLIAPSRQPAHIPPVPFSTKRTGHFLLAES